MRLGLRVCRRRQAASLRLYPVEFQVQFAEEMQAVFSAQLSDAAQGGLVAVVKTCGRELLDLPASVAREHWPYGPEVGMPTLRFPNHATRWGSAWP